MTNDSESGKKMRDSKLLIATVGLPRSGKTTWAKSVGLPIINPDSIRLALHGERYISIAEPWVWAIAKTMVRSLFLAGHYTIILDATNTTRKRRDEWQSDEWKTVFKVFDVSAAECIERAGNDEIIKPVIMRMVKDFVDLCDDEIELHKLGVIEINEVIKSIKAIK